MSETKQLAVTVKTPESERYAGDNPWFVFEGDPPTVAQNVIATFGLTNVKPDASVAEIVLAAQVVLTALASAVRGGAAAPPPVAPFQQPAPQQQGGWNTSPSEVVPTWAAQSAQPQAPAAPQQQGIRLHPEGIKCPVDGNVVQFKEINSRKTGKAYQMWTCPNQRSRGDGHFSEFAN